VARPSNHEVGGTTNVGTRQYRTEMTDFELPGDLSFNLDAIEDAAPFVRNDARAFVTQAFEDLDPRR
jgi:hypothetical protein